AFAQAENRRVTYTQFTQTYAETPEAAFPWVITILVGIGVVLSVLALWRSLRGGAVCRDLGSGCCGFCTCDGDHS
ncbi:MAG: hypothetical protein P8P40_00255, partial [Sulfitobacter sp.]|nr:hypothetical protein [Sulfitobacter sp.]